MLQQLLILMATCVVLSFFNTPVFAEADVDSEEDEEVTFTEENTRKKIPWRLYRVIEKDSKDDDTPLPSIPSKLNDSSLEGLFTSDKAGDAGKAETENKADTGDKAEAEDKEAATESEAADVAKKDVNSAQSEETATPPAAADDESESELDDDIEEDD